MKRDPVCGKKINRVKAYAVVDYQKVQYYLCCPVCQTQFEAQPKRFARPEFGTQMRKPD